ILRVGDIVAGMQVNDIEFVCGLNDKGDVLFTVGTAAGSWALLQYADRKFVPIAASGGPAPWGRWPEHTFFVSGTPAFGFWQGRASMNQHGNAVFSAHAN